MRFVFALLAVLALLSSPMTAAAAQLACSEDGPTAMAGMGMPDMAGMDHAGDPCCDHNAKPGMSKDCAQACATWCALMAALPSEPMSIVFATVRAPPVLIRQGLPTAFEPSGPERPPKSMV